MYLVDRYYNGSELTFLLLTSITEAKKGSQEFTNITQNNALYNE